MNNTLLINIGPSPSPHPKYIKAHFPQAIKKKKVSPLRKRQYRVLELDIVYIQCIKKKRQITTLKLYHTMFLLGRSTDMGARCLCKNIILSTEKWFCPLSLNSWSFAETLVSLPTIKQEVIDFRPHHPSRITAMGKS